MTMATKLVAQCEYLLLDAIEKSAFDVTSPTAVVAKCMEIVETFPQLKGENKKKLVMQVIERVIAGKDGVVGTADDVLAPGTVLALQTMLNTDMLSDTIQIIADITTGKFDINKVKKAAMTSMPSCCLLFDNIKKVAPSLVIQMTKRIKK